MKPNIYPLHIASIISLWDTTNTSLKEEIEGKVYWNTVNPNMVNPTTRMIRHYIYGPAKTLIYPMYFTTVNPTTQMIRHFFAGPLGYRINIVPVFTILSIILLPVFTQQMSSLFYCSTVVFRGGGKF